ncbi:hypothetical protein HZB58_03810 [Candidatus Gottesmanbacteria bacterium]|nr:hypothetical protein [Candidatus Gottesmanbacteria bacterium]
MSGDGERDDGIDVRWLTKTLLSLLNRDKPAKKTDNPVSTGKVVEIAPSIVQRDRPRSRLRKLSEGRGRDMRQLSDLPDDEIIRLAKKSGRILRARDVAMVRSTAGRNGAVADIIDAMDQNGLFES